MILATESLYSGKPGIQQEEFFRQAREGWVDLQEDTQNTSQGVRPNMSTSGSWGH